MMTATISCSLPLTNLNSRSRYFYSYARSSPLMPPFSFSPHFPVVPIANPVSNAIWTAVYSPPDAVLRQRPPKRTHVTRQRRPGGVGCQVQNGRDVGGRGTAPAGGRLRPAKGLVQRLGGDRAFCVWGNEWQLLHDATGRGAAFYFSLLSHLSRLWTLERGLMSLMAGKSDFMEAAVESVDQVSSDNASCPASVVCISEAYASHLFI